MGGGGLGLEKRCGLGKWVSWRNMGGKSSNGGKNKSEDDPSTQNNDFFLNFVTDMAYCLS